MEKAPGTAGTPAEPGTTGTPGEGTTGTPGEAAGAAGTPEGEEEKQPQRTYKVNVGGEEREMSEAEVLDRANRSAGLEVGAEEKNRRIDELETELGFRQVEQGFAGDGRQPPPQQPPPAGYYPQAPYQGQQPVYPQPGFGGQPQPVDPMLQNLDPSDPKDVMLAQMYQAMQQQGQVIAGIAQTQTGNSIASILREQHGELSRSFGKEYNRKECLAVITEGLQQGMRYDLNTAFQIVRGRRSDQTREKGRRDAEHRGAIEGAQNAGTAAVASISGAGPAAPARVIPKAQLPSSLAEYGRLKREGWVPDNEGNLVKRT